MSRRVALKFRKEGSYIRERLIDPATLRGWRFRTKLSGGHRMIFAFPPGKQRSRSGVLQAILHPLAEAEGRGNKFACRGDACRRVR